MLFMGDYEGHAALKALLATDDAQNSKYKADVWVLPHHGAALQLEGKFLIWLESLYVFVFTGCPAKLFTLGYLLFCGLLLMQIAKSGTFLKNSGNLLHDRHKNFENFLNF